MDAYTWLALVLIIGTIVVGFSKRFSYVQVLIMGNLLVFLMILLNFYVGDGLILKDLGTEPVYLTTFTRPWTYITYMFVHASYVHIIGNMLFLFLIGVQLEYRVGKNRTALLYFATGLASLLIFALIEGIDSTALIVGASGAVSGLIGAMFWLYPRDKIPFFLGPLFLPNVPVVLGAGVFLVTQLVLDLTSTYGGVSGGVAYSAHVGGFVAGMALAAVLPKPAAKVEESADLSALEPLATTKQLREELDIMKKETEPSVRRFWLEHFVKGARCPQCGGRLELKGGKVRSECGYEVKLK